jgi:hypothetical protein
LSKKIIKKELFLTLTYIDVMNGTKLTDYESRGILKNDLDLLIKENGGDYRQNKTADIVIAGVHSK